MSIWQTNFKVEECIISKIKEIGVYSHLTLALVEDCQIINYISHLISLLL